MHTDTFNIDLRHGKKRSAFTIVELMVVIAIIGLLLAIGGIAIANSITQAKERATRALLLKLDGMLQQRFDGFNTLINKQQQQLRLQTLGVPAVKLKLQAAGVAGVPTAMLNLMAYKDAFRQAFPQTAADNPSLTAAQQYFNGNAQDSKESSEYLYWILTKSDSYGATAVDDSEFGSAEVRDTDGDTRMEFVDAWGRPLRFYRWTTRLLRPAGPGTTISTVAANLLITGLPDAVDLQIDPDDAIGVYNATVAAGVITPALYEQLYQTPDTWSIPLIVSCGADGLKPNSLGLYEPYDGANFGNLAQPLPTTVADPGNSSLNDNLTNRQKTK